jgi:hypothetical protein
MSNPWPRPSPCGQRTPHPGGSIESSPRWVDTPAPCGGETFCAVVNADTPALPSQQVTWQSPFGGQFLETKPLVPRAQFLASNAVPCPGDSLEAVRGDILTTRFAQAVGSTGATCKRTLNFLQCSAAQIGSHHRDILLNGPDGKLHRIRRLHTGRKGLGFAPRGSQNLIALLQQETSIRPLRRLRCCSHASLPFPNLTRKTICNGLPVDSDVRDHTKVAHFFEVFWWIYYVLIFQFVGVDLGCGIIGAVFLTFRQQVGDFF